MAESDWAKLKVVDLKAELKRRALPQHGLKAELVARLEESDNEPAPSAEDEQVVGETKEDGVDQQTSAPEVEAVAVQPEPSQPAVVDSEDVEQPTSNGGTAPTEKEDDGGAQSKAEPEAAPQNEEQAGPAELPAEVAATIPETVEGAPAPMDTDPIAKPVLPEESSLEAIPDAQKRKRRSASPPPTEDSIARKRAKAHDDGANGSRARMESDTSASEPPVQARPASPLSRDPAAREAEAQPSTAPGKGEAMDYERVVAPAVHPATSALYINNLMRPLRPNDVRAHLVNLATPPDSAPDDTVIEKFHLDQIRTHAFVVFGSTSAASRVRTSLHDCVWPNESNRKALWVDYVPLERVDEWIEMEDSQGGGRTGSRWEVVYEDGPNGEVEARLESCAVSSSRPGPATSSRLPPGKAMEDMNSIPLGPRSQREPPTGPRAVAPGTGPGPRPPPIPMAETNAQRTRARPRILYQAVSDDLARRRIDNMHSYYTRDPYRDLGREINRYSFEHGDSFVDRGKEVFEGIRPPHRERAMDRDRRGGGGRRGGRGGGRGRGGPPFRPRSDRYLPGDGGGSRMDDRLPRYDEEDDRGRLPRYPDDRDPGRGGAGGDDRGGYWDSRW